MRIDQLELRHRRIHEMHGLFLVELGGEGMVRPQRRRRAKRGYDSGSEY
jgi:hypothetical protein